MFLRDALALRHERMTGSAGNLPRNIDFTGVRDLIEGLQTLFAVRPAPPGQVSGSQPGLPVESELTGFQSCSKRHPKLTKNHFFLHDYVLLNIFSP